jgi:hypothetical protein
MTPNLSQKPQNGVEVFGASKKKMFVRKCNLISSVRKWKMKTLFVNISGPFCMPFNSDFRVTEIPE